MGQKPTYRRGWHSVTQEPGHPLAVLEGRMLGDFALSVSLGPTSRFGARYFALYVAQPAFASGDEPVATGLHNSGPLPTYNWIEIAETRERVALPEGGEASIGEGGLQRLFEMLVDLIPAGGHIMVEYDSRERAETARCLSLGVPPLATPLGEMLFRAGCGAHFKDWQIAEGGGEGPRKLQAYKPPAPEHAERWERSAASQLAEFLEGPEPTSDAVRSARARAKRLLRELGA